MFILSASILSLFYAFITLRGCRTVVVVDGDPALVAQELLGSVSQMDGDGGVYSGQLCWGSELLGTVISLQTIIKNNPKLDILQTKQLFFVGWLLHTSRQVEEIVGSKSRKSINWTKTGAADAIYRCPQSRAKR